MMSNLTSHKKYNPVNYYFIADPSFWPIIGSIGIFTTVIGLVQLYGESLIFVGRWCDLKLLII